MRPATLHMVPNGCVYVWSLHRGNLGAIVCVVELWGAGKMGKCEEEKWSICVPTRPFAAPHSCTTHSIMANMGLKDASIDGLSVKPRVNVVLCVV